MLLNCDMGEGIDNDEQLMPFIQAANIACGYHAGDPTIMWNTGSLALKHNVLIGAHPSFPDRENFGRTEMQLPQSEIYELVIQQLIVINDIITSIGSKLHHVKPHGALYNMSALDSLVAETIANAVRDFDDSLVLFGLSGSQSIYAAHKIGLKTANEVFADRTYQDNGTLTPRSQTGALIENVDQVAMQVLQMEKEGKVTTVTGHAIPVKAETVCIHGDGSHAVEFAKRIRLVLDGEH